MNNNKNVLAGIVTFNPDKERLLENISAINNQVGKLVIVDNGSDNIDEIEACKTQFPEMIVYKFGNNRGIAAALNRIGEFAVSENYDYFLTLDQDSVVLPGLIDAYQKYLELPKLGLLNCYQTDRNVIEKDSELPKEVETLTFVRTSGSLMPTALFIDGIKYDEDLFIDKVDYDLNLLLAKNNYKLYRIPYYGLVHELGYISYHNFLGRKVMSFNYSPFRRYYIVRNSILLMRKYGINKVTLKWLLNDFIDGVKTLLFEQEKWKKTQGALKGLWDGIRYET